MCLINIIVKVFWIFFFNFLTNSKQKTSKDFFVILDKYIRNNYETQLEKHVETTTCILHNNYVLNLIF